MGFVIGSNNLAAALTLGTLGQVERRWRIFLVFGVFEFLMPLLGVWAGEKASTVVGEVGSVLSVLVLLGLAVLAFYAAIKPAKTDRKLADKLTTWKDLVLLELGLSLDNLLAGFGIGLGHVNISPLLLAATIAAFSVLYTWLGLNVGRKVTVKWQNFAQTGAGVLLCLLAALSWFGLV
ncbi:manganese efflux pump [Pontibacter populi]|uniref:Manganese efflux pump n=1 Tax=Pontibacter populi TaxID=890055 RepID=A0ABV1RWF6_9BACT